jgi:hypothetical protein
MAEKRKQFKQQAAKKVVVNSAALKESKVATHVVQQPT